MKMILQPRRNYGKVLYWPMCPTSKAIASLQRDKRIKEHTITKLEMDLLESIGFKIELIPHLEVEK